MSTEQQIENLKSTVEAIFQPALNDAHLRYRGYSDLLNDHKSEYFFNGDLAKKLSLETLLMAQEIIVLYAEERMRNPAEQVLNPLFYLNWLKGLQ